MAQRIRHLTGITTTGTPHLGNYVGAIRPAIAASRRADAESFFFLADYHALVKSSDPARVQRSTREIAASWLACGLDPARVVFYRQSDIPEIPELTWLLTCVAAKGLLNRAHAYKAAVDQNLATGEDPDAGISMGLFMYPVLMAADILMFGADQVPVGRDQVQHIEMARDFAARFNHLYGDSYRALTGRDGEPLVLPEAVVDDAVATLPGLDGRKMSKSYDNAIALFAPAAELKKLVYSIVTDSREPGEPKDPDTSHLFTLYQAFATVEETAAMRAAFREGIGWGEAKQRAFERIDAELAPMRETYRALIDDPAQIESTLRAGAQKARALSRPLLRELRQAVGLRPLDLQVAESATAGNRKAAQPVFKQYREADGLFYFKLVDAGGDVLLHSAAFTSPREAGQAVARLKQGAGRGLDCSESGEVAMEGQVLGRLGGDADARTLAAALAAFGGDAC